MAKKWKDLAEAGIFISRCVIEHVQDSLQEDREEDYNLRIEILK